MPLRGTLSNTWARIQGQLFPWLQDELMVGIEAFVQTWRGLPGRPLADRHALARAFAAKAVLRLPTTTGLIERLKVDKNAAPAVRVGAPGPGAERSNVLASLRGVRR